jgi:hypothetical protein
VAGPIAKQFVELIAPYCHQVVIAGSLRRRLPTVADVEIVAVPKVEDCSAGMFEEMAAPTDLLDRALEGLLLAGAVEKRPRADGATFWGPRAKYLTFEGMPVDLFATVNDWRKPKAVPTSEPERFGIILVIRTGPAAFSHRLVTPKDQTVVVGHKANGHEIRRPGLLPTMYRQHEGWLTSRVSGERIATPDEETVFKLLGIEYAEPWLRG